MKLLYFTLADFDEMYGGVYKKVLSQIKVLKEQGFEVDYTYKEAGNFIINRHDLDSLNLARAGKRFSRGLCNKRFLEFMKREKYDVVFIRYPHTDFLFQHVLSIWKRNQSKIVIEFPTFPYEDELKQGMAKKIRLFLDRVFRHQLKKYVQLVATYSADKEIYGIPAIHIVNGIDFSNIALKNVNQNAALDIHLIAVSTMYQWHGYDRLILGLHQYYSKGGERNIILHLVGTGTEVEPYKCLVQQFNLESHVLFYGAKSGKDLDAIYDKCDIGIESLGNHRRHVYLSSSLKSREYAAKGLPLITSCEIDVFPSKATFFVKKLEEDDSPININEIISFYDGIFTGHDKEKIAIKIREDAKKVCDMTECMEPIVNWMKSVSK